MTQRHHTKIDERGFVVLDLNPEWQTIVERNNPRPRKGMPWSPAEDRALLTRARELEHDAQAAWTIAAELGRTPCAIQTRLHSIRAGLRLAALAKLTEEA